MMRLPSPPHDDSFPDDQRANTRASWTAVHARKLLSPFARLIGWLLSDELAAADDGAAAAEWAN